MEESLEAIYKNGPPNGEPFNMAERQGFEPWELLHSPVFKTGAFDHSATSPKLFLTPERVSILLLSTAQPPGGRRLYMGFEQTQAPSISIC